MTGKVPSGDPHDFISSLGSWAEVLEPLLLESIFSRFSALCQGLSLTLGSVAVCLAVSPGCTDVQTPALAQHPLGLSQLWCLSLLPSFKFLLPSWS